VCIAPKPCIRDGAEEWRLACSFKGSAGIVDYASTKGAIVAFTKSVALQQAKYGIRCNAVARSPSSFCAPSSLSLS
jgi:enoyl-[acyl-carrier-protein] reductase (NADH)